MAAEVEVLPEAKRSTYGLPRSFGKYLLYERIGRGGMAEIFLARMTTELGGVRSVVLKQILPEYSAEPGFTRAFIGEAKVAAELSHGNIVRVLDLGRESDRLYIAMEYVEGFDLNQLLGLLSRRRLPLPAEFALLIVREVLAALDYAHRAHDAHGAPLGVVHRDISPANVLVSVEGEVKLCDFGIARAFRADASETGMPSAHGSVAPGPGSPAGKGAYMAPEQARGELVDARSDVYGVGILLWELLAGRRLSRSSQAGSAAGDWSWQPPPLPERPLPQRERLQHILSLALAHDPAMRYQSAHQMRVALEDYALCTQLMASQLRFATFLAQHLSDAIATQLRDRERAAQLALRAPTPAGSPVGETAAGQPPSAAPPGPGHDVPAPGAASAARTDPAAGARSSVDARGRHPDGVAAAAAPAQASAAQGRQPSARAAGAGPRHAPGAVRGYDALARELSRDDSAALEALRPPRYWLLAIAAAVVALVFVLWLALR